MSKKDKNENRDVHRGRVFGKDELLSVAEFVKRSGSGWGGSQGGGGGGGGGAPERKPGEPAGFFTVASSEPSAD